MEETQTIEEEIFSHRKATKKNNKEIYNQPLC